MRRVHLVRVAGAVLAVAMTATSSDAQSIIPAAADTTIRTDLDVRRNDNYGKDSLLLVGTGRGGGGIPHGGADAIRALIKFDITGLTRPVARAVLELTVYGYDHGMPNSTYAADLHRIVPGPPLTPWAEGDGNEGRSPGLAGPPPNAVGTDPAAVVAWAGAGDNPDPAAANNTTQPPFDPIAAARAIVHQDTDPAGTVIRWDITPLVNAWITGTPNEGILLRDPTSDGHSRGVWFFSREARPGGPAGVAAPAGPRLVLTPLPGRLAEPPTDAGLAAARELLRRLAKQVQAQRAQLREAEADLERAKKLIEAVERQGLEGPGGS